MPKPLNDGMSSAVITFEAAVKRLGLTWDKRHGYRRPDGSPIKVQHIVIEAAKLPPLPAEDL